MELFGSFSLLMPVALLTLFSLLIPVLIHLLNRTKGRIVLIGNIELIKQAKKIKITEIKFSKILLLIIRLLILIALALIMSQLVTYIYSSKSDEQRVYIMPEWVEFSSDEEILTMLGQHKKAKLYWLTKKIPQIKRENITAFKQSYHSLSKKEQYFQIDTLLAELDNQPQVGIKNVIYATNRLNHYALSKQLRNHHYLWHIKELTHKDINSYSNYLKPNKVLILYETNRTKDLNYLKVAFNYLNSVHKQQWQLDILKIDSSLKNKVKESHAKNIFWLSSDSVIPEILMLVHKGAFLIEDSQGNQLIRKASSFRSANHTVNIFIKTQLAVSELSETIYRDNNNEIVLSKKNYGLGIHYYFSSRFNPVWNNWLEQVSFPVEIADLLLNRPLNNMSKVVSQQELSVPPSTIPITKYEHRLEKILLIILCLLWFIERLLVEQQAILKSFSKKVLVHNDK
ncbi:BatA domain-containing protein [Aliikangiella sp. IMCC44359]|uniref:BatA domain-containing protein n=1 Tax=Aliikangiella sp. IMCC44359 TaxID=3459125 RepID=UPI00403A9F06